MGLESTGEGGARLALTLADFGTIQERLGHIGSASNIMEKSRNKD